MDGNSIEFRNSELCKTKFVDKSIEILNCWASLPDKFLCLKKVAFAMVSAFGSSYMCKQVFSHMKIILNPNRSRLTENSDACVILKVTRHEPEIEKLSRETQGQGSH